MTKVCCEYSKDWDVGVQVGCMGVDNVGTCENRGLFTCQCVRLFIWDVTSTR